ncbi:MAG TPA: PAS domain S-box protein, partial [Ferruginibacter sp.]|nr:PAS domain S-box protein [Ferruginibacter sp.]
MKTMTKILIAEHDPVDLEMIHNELLKGGIKYISEVVKTELAYIHALETFIPDIIFSDYSFPSFNGVTAFKIKEKMCPDTPFILVSGTIGEENSIELIKDGVTDFVLKDKMFTLNTKLVRALKDAENRKQKNKTDKELSENVTHLAEAQRLAKMGSWDYNIETDKLTWSKELYNVFGSDKKDLIKTYGSFVNLVDEEDRLLVQQTSRHTQLTGEPFTLEYHITTCLGEKRIIREQGHGKKDETGKITRLFGTAQDITESRRSETAVRKAYEEKNAVLESIEDGFFAVDKNSLVTYWNKKAEKLLGKRRADVIGKNLHEIFDGRDSNIFYDNYKKAIRDNTTVRFEAFSILSNKWFAVSAFASDNGLSVYFKDVTDQKKDEEKIKESELRYRSIIEQANDAICIADPSMKILDINLYGCQMLGYSKAEFLQLSINDLFLSEDLLANPFRIEELRSGKVIRNERRFKRKDGTLIDVEMSGRILVDGRFIVFGHDIAERKKAQDKIKESELRYRSLHEQATDAICITDPSLKFIEINPYGCEIFGYTKEEALQLSLTDILFTEDLTDNPLKVAELGLGKTVRNERRLKRKDGTAVDMEVSTKLMEDGRMIMFGHDITKRKKAEEKLRKANRLYTFISQVNQNIVHIKDESELFRNACQIAFEFGRFKIAWIGIIDKANKTITVADQNGIPIEDLPVFTNANYERNGPVDHVLRTGAYYLRNNIQQDPELESRKPLAAKHGIQSVIVLPVKKSGQIIGTFNLYAAEANFFDKEEIELLTDVTEDISFALDIFEKAKKQKETEELVVKNEKRFRALIEKSVDMKTLSTLDGEMIYGSPSILGVLGYTPEEFCNRSAFELMHPDDIPGFREKRNEILNTPGRSFYSQNRFLHKNGSWIWCEGNVTNMLHEPGVHAMVSNFKDISDRKMAEQQRDFDRNNLNALINNTSDLMWTVDKNCKLITFNQPFFEIIKLVSGKELA